MSGTRDGFAANARCAILDWVNVGIPHTRDPRGSPFQLPTRLADGLGLESDLGRDYPRPCAPSSNTFEEFGSPALTFRKESQLRLLQMPGTIYCKIG
jgi:hypothetical protein